ncbi:MAG: 30S ribosomal protein S9 [Candidatus Pacebacteria bacterium]|nr:30S ribosomal protein S9 [Candidatus Paceibacterota bacterium]
MPKTKKEAVGAASPASKDKKDQSKKRYIEGIGRRKTSTARVRITAGHTGFTINGKDFKEYFKGQKEQEIVLSSLDVAKGAEKFGVTVMVNGGGLSGQAGAIRMGMARALVKFDEELRKRLRKMGYLTRDSRMVERKKYGLRKARRAPQWAKR